MKKKAILLFLSALMLTGCNQTPSTTVVDNAPVETTQDKVEETIDVENLPQISMYEEEINQTLELGEVTLTINGIVAKPDTTDGLYTYFAEFKDYEKYLNNMFFLFGEYEDRKYLEAEAYYRVDVPEIEYWGHLYADINGTGGVKYYYVPRPVAEDKRRVELSNEEAIAIADDTLSRIGVTEVVYDTCIYEEEYIQITPEGTPAATLGDRLHIYYLQKLQGVPVRSALTTKRKNLITTVSFSSSGISNAKVSVLEYNPYYKIENCISYEEALEKFKETVAKESSFNGININKVMFEYTLVNEYVDGEFITISVPCWHFYREVPLWMGYSEVDVVVNAITGETTIL